MLQNRVDPAGNIIRTPARGTFTGTRGILHNEHQEIVRPFKLKAWLTCLLEFKGRRRSVMAPDRYTSLFFLDEATAFAAGHRPCAECRREDFNLFKQAWLKGNPGHGFTIRTKIQHIDDVLHRERIDKQKKKVIYTAPFSSLPDGTFIHIGDAFYMVAKGALHGWTPSGYCGTMDMDPSTIVTVLTPRSFVNTFRSGYKPRFTIS